MIWSQARLAVLERGLNIKAEPPDGSAGVRAEGPSNLKHEREERGLNIKAEPPDGSAGVRAEGPSNLKHEREEDENPAPQQRRRTSVKIETVDLTEG